MEQQPPHKLLYKLYMDINIYIYIYVLAVCTYLSRDALETGKSNGNGGEACTVVINITRKTHTGSSHNMSGDGQHGNTTVLDLDVAQTVETVLILLIDHVEGVPEAEGCLGAELILEASSLQSGVGGLGSGRSEGCSGGGEGSGNCEFHC